MLKKNGFLILSGLSILVLISGCAFGPGSGPQPNKSNLSKTNDTLEKNNKINLYVNTSKEKYRVGEKIKGNYIVQNNGPSLLTYIIYSYGKKDIPQMKCIESSIQTLDKNSTAAHLLDTPKIIDQGKGIYCGKNKFNQAGDHTYEIRIYPCDKIKEEFGECEIGIDERKIKRKLSPIEKTKKVVPVTE